MSKEEHGHGGGHGDGHGHGHSHGGHNHHSQNFIRRLDLFGHTISLNFDMFEYKRKTMFGGVMSIILGILGCILISI